MVHTFVHRLCMSRWSAKGSDRERRRPVLNPCLTRSEAHSPLARDAEGQVNSEKMLRGEISVPTDANNHRCCGSNGCPQATLCADWSMDAGFAKKIPKRGRGSRRRRSSGAGRHRWPLGLTPEPRTAYRYAVEPVSTGAACPRTTTRTRSPEREAVVHRGWAVPAEQEAVHQAPQRHPCPRPGPRTFPSHTRHRESNLVSKRTFQPNNRRRHKTHGFRLRMRTRAGRAILGARRRKGRTRLAA